MNLKIRKAVALAVAAGSLGASAAYAIPPTNFSAAEQASNVLRFSGATATDATTEDIYRLASGGLCNSAAGTISIFRSQNNDGTFLNGQQRAILCVGAGTLAGQDIAFLKESEFGSGSGSVFVSAAGAGVNIEFLDVFNANFACGGIDGNITTNDAGTYNPLATPTPIDNPRAMSTAGGRQATGEYLSCGGQALFQAQAGISDVETSLIGADGGQATPTTQFQILFGTPVSLNLYRALQVAQGLTATAACDTAAEQDTEACVPTLNKTTIAGFFSGAITDWSQLEEIDGDPITGIDIPGAAGPITDTTVYICRRGNSSGTQVGTRAYYLGQGCGGSDQFTPSTNGTPNGEANGNVYSNATFGNTVVFAGDGSGDVRNCLDDRDDQNRWAVGVLSTENALDGTVTLAAGGNTTAGNIGGDGGTPTETLRQGASEAFSREYRFVRINGVLPSIEAAANGGYDFYTENACYARNGALAGTELAMYTAMCGPNGFGALPIIQALNAGFDNQPNGDGGLMAIPGIGTNAPNDFPVTQTEMATNPVNTWTKSFSGAINNCSQSQPFGDSPVGSLPGPTT